MQNQIVKRCTNSGRQQTYLTVGMEREIDSIYAIENFKRSAHVKMYNFAFAFPEECKEISNEIITERFLKTKRIALATMQNNKGLGQCLKFFLLFHSPTLLLDKVVTK